MKCDFCFADGRAMALAGGAANATLCPTHHRAFNNWVHDCCSQWLAYLVAEAWAEATLAECHCGRANADCYVAAKREEFAAHKTLSRAVYTWLDKQAAHAGGKE